MSFLQKLEAELELAQAEIRRLNERDSKWRELIRCYRVFVWKQQRKKKIDYDEWQVANRLKNELGIGNGILRSE